jgi:hypothetical protein
MKRILHVVMLSLLMIPANAAVYAKTRTRKPAPPKEMTQPTSSDEEEKERGAKRVTGAKLERKAAGGTDVVSRPVPQPAGPPRELVMKRARSVKFDLRRLPQTPPPQIERAETPEPVSNPVTIDNPNAQPSPVASPVRSAPAPAPTGVFEGLDRFNWGAGSPPDTNGDVGPNHYIQTVNSSIGIYRKTDGAQLAAFTFNTFMSQGQFGNLCDTNNFGDPVVLYDSFEDRWVITDFAFLTDAGGNTIGPAYQCVAASMTGDPVNGGWSFYSIQSSDYLNDYPKFAVWTDGIYMSGNMFTFGVSSFRTARVWAFDKAQMYAGSPTAKVVSFDVAGGDFTVIPSNARLQTGTPPPGRPNLYLSTQLFLNALTIYKFHVDWDHISLSTFTGPDTPISATSWPTFAAAVPQPGTTQTLDSLSNRAMVQNQYTNFAGTESLWASHTVRRQNTSGFAAPRWYQVNVTGGNVNPTIPQAATWDPDAANVIHRWMPSVAVDRAGNLAMGYSTSNSTTEFPSIKYAGRLAADPVNTFSLTEQTLYAGTASQLSSTRWGDYSGMTLDPDGCRFWFTTEYPTGLDTPPVAPATTSPGFNRRWATKFGSIPPFPGCVPVGAGGTISGAVTTNPGGSPISGATVQLGARSTSTDGSGNYAFSIPAGMYPTMAAAKPGFGSASTTSVAVTDGGTTTQNFSLTAAPPSACLTDTTQTDFQTGVPTTVDLNTTPGDVTLSNAPALDQSNTAGTSTGTGFGTPAWTGQTFVAGLSGLLVQADVQLFCNGCGATPPNLTLSLRATAAGLPTGADLASVSIPGAAFASGSTVFASANFPSPASVVAGTQYALILRPVSAPAGSGYFWIRSSPSTYASGSRVLSADSGTTWSADTTRDYNFRAYVRVGYTATGNLVSAPKDSNAASGLTPIWSTFSWNGAVPANTELKFQLAGSNNVNGPFTFVGPDGTAGTYYTSSPATLTQQFYNTRYMEYKAFFATSDVAVTSTLNDASFCFNDADCSGSITVTPAATVACANSTGNTASGPAGAFSYSWSITNGSITGGQTSQTVTYTAGASGSVGLTLDLVEAAGCHKSGSATVPIPDPPTATPGGPTTFCAGGSVTLTSSAGNSYQWFLDGNPIGGATNQTYVATASGSYTVAIEGCTNSPSSAVVVTSNPYPAVPTIAGTTNGTGTQDQACPEQPLTLTATSAGAETYQWYQDNNTLNGETNSTYQATAVGTYYVTASSNGCVTAQSAGYVVQNPTPHAPFLTAGGPTTFCTGGSVTLQSNSATGIQWYKDGVAIPGAGSQNYVATVSGSYNAQLNALGCHSQIGNPIVVTVNPLPEAPVVTPGGPTTFCAGGSVTLTSSSATGNQWLLNGNPIGGATAQQYVATLSGDYAVTTTDGNSCTSAASQAVSVTVNPLPATPTITPGGPTTFCTGGSVTLTSSAASGNQWFVNGNPIGGATGTAYVATSSGSYTVNTTNGNSCTSAASAATGVTVNSIPATPVIGTGGPTTFCSGGSVTLTSSSATGNQWYVGGNPIGGATAQQYVATGSGSYTVIVTTSGCSSASSAAQVVTVNPTPTTPTITPGGPTSFCTGGSVTLTSSSASGNQWSLNGSPLGGATSQQYVATITGDYTVVVTTSGCSSAASSATHVTVNAPPNATITAPASVNSGSTGNAASVADAGVGATYAWTISGGTITAGTGTRSITFTAGAIGTLTLNVTVTTAAGCSDAKGANVAVSPTPVSVTSVVPATGPLAGGTNVTINGSGFAAGATVTFGGTAATNVVIVSGIKITAKTPAHAAGAVAVKVTNVDTTNGTLAAGFTYAQQFDPNGDGVTDPADIFFLVNYLFTSGPAPHGGAGMLSGDANGDGAVTPADIFYLINYLFLGGPAPKSLPAGRVAELSSPSMAGALSLGAPVLRGDRYFIPVTVTTAAGAEEPQALSLRLRFSAGVADAAIARAGAARDLEPAFEISRASARELSYVVLFDARNAVSGGGRPFVVAEVSIPAAGAAGMGIELDPSVTMLSDAAGARAATVGNGRLRLTGTAIPDRARTPKPTTPEAH